MLLLLVLSALLRLASGAAANGAADYYKTLDIPRTASTKEIKTAYRKKALQWHPDKAKPENRVEAEKRFREVAEAYEVLSDESRRADYDNPGRGHRRSSPFGGANFRSADDIFKDFFGDEDPFANMDKIFESMGQKGDPFGAMFGGKKGAGSMFGGGFGGGSASFSFSSTTTTTSGGRTVTKTTQSSTGTDGKERRRASVEERVGGKTIRKAERSSDDDQPDAESTKAKRRLDYGF